MNRRLRLSLTIILVVVVLAAFADYISKHRYLITRLSHTPPTTIIWLLILYTAWFGALCLILAASVAMCKKSVTIKENVLLNGYSTLVNFFVPGQGGIIVRGAYFKKIKNLAVRNYVLVSLIYFMFYALLSGFFLLAFNQAWWKTIGAIVLIGGISIAVIYFYITKSKKTKVDIKLSLNSVAYLLVATLIQGVIQISIYAVELHSVNSKINLHQAITYTGAANFALFVALTPGAIGIRESFLLLTRHLNGISEANIIGASIIDRAVFLVFLLIIFLLTLGFHAKYRDILRPAPKNQDFDSLE